MKKSFFKIVPFAQLKDRDLIVDAVYRGGKAGNASDDPISKLLSCGNQGGFRYRGSSSRGLLLCVLYSELSDPDWPDALDLERGRFIYYGDNKTPGHEIHESRGNRVLRDVFDSLHSGARDR